MKINKKLKAILRENKKQKKLLQKQARHAQLGEIINIIAHQWKQPLNTLSLLVSTIAQACDNNSFDKEHINNPKDKSLHQIESMNRIINNCINFAKKNKKTTSFHVRDSFSNALNILSVYLNQNNIAFSIRSDNISINGSSDKFEQIILNLINNSKDIILNFKEVSTSKHTINLQAKEYKRKVIITISNDICCISKRKFNKILTNKNIISIRLYIAKIMAKNAFNAKIKAQYKPNSIIFKIIIPKDK